mmetsp:Transcript_18895/g.44161  ORF Transcript_18895/g.44161 Transcript_18895/m.44161 type:complete len:248 (-) Transcript_18895:1123-1866(-)
MRLGRRVVPKCHAGRLFLLLLSSSMGRMEFVFEFFHTFFLVLGLDAFSQSLDPLNAVGAVNADVAIFHGHLGFSQAIKIGRIISKGIGQFHRGELQSQETKRNDKNENHTRSGGSGKVRHLCMHNAHGQGEEPNKQEDFVHLKQGQWKGRCNELVKTGKGLEKFCHKIQEPRFFIAGMLPHSVAILEPRAIALLENLTSQIHGQAVNGPAGFFNYIALLIGHVGQSLFERWQVEQFFVVVVLRGIVA